MPLHVYHNEVIYFRSNKRSHLGLNNYKEHVFESHTTQIKYLKSNLSGYGTHEVVSTSLYTKFYLISLNTANHPSAILIVPLNSFDFDLLVNVKVP